MRGFGTSGCVRSVGIWFARREVHQPVAQRPNARPVDISTTFNDPVMTAVRVSPVVRRQFKASHSQVKPIILQTVVKLLLTYLYSLDFTIVGENSLRKLASTV